MDPYFSSQLFGSAFFIAVFTPLKATGKSQNQNHQHPIGKCWTHAKLVGG
jgi:hypothetical protein